MDTGFLLNALELGHGDHCTTLQTYYNHEITYLIKIYYPSPSSNTPSFSRAVPKSYHRVPQSPQPKARQSKCHIN